MIRSGRYSRDPVYARRETISDVGSELAVDSNIVETLEKGEDTWVGGLRRVKGLDLFNDNVIVPDNLSTVVQLLRCTKVCRGSIGKGTGLHSLSVLTRMTE